MNRCLRTYKLTAEIHAEDFNWRFVPLKMPLDRTFVGWQFDSAGELELFYDVNPGGSVREVTFMTMGVAEVYDTRLWGRVFTFVDDKHRVWSVMEQKAA